MHSQIFLWLSIFIVCSFAAKLPHTSFQVTKEHTLDILPVSKSIIVTGVKASVLLHEKAAVYCRINVSSVEDLHKYKIIWRDPCSNIIRGCKNSEPYCVVGSTDHMPYSYLTFNKFQKKYAGEFTCQLIKNNQVVQSSSISIAATRRNGRTFPLPSIKHHKCKRRGKNNKMPKNEILRTYK